MHYVNAEEVMQLFRKYVEAYNGLISKEIAYEELENALDSANGVYVKEGMIYI